MRLTLARFRRDRWSVAAAVVFALVVLVSFAGGPLVSRLEGHNGYDQFPYATNADFRPVGPLTRVPARTTGVYDQYGDLLKPPKGKTTLFVLGADGPLGRDELIRVLDGGKTSLEIAIFAVLVALLIGVPLGTLGGYFGGLIDAIGSRVTETVMAFPLLLFLVFASVQLDRVLDPIGFGWWFPRGVIAEALLIGAFTSFYPTRLVRAQALQLRRAEFIESAEMVGASHWRILRRHLLPHLAPTIIVWAAVGLAARRTVGNDPRPAAVQHARLLSLADDLPVARDPDRGRVAEPARGRLSSRTRPVDAAMTRGVAFIGRRAVAGLFTLIVMTSVTFWLFWATKTEPSHFLYAGHAGALTPYEVVHGHKLLGTDKPKLEQWWHYETHLLRFDFGKAWEGAAIIDNSKLI